MAYLNIDTEAGVIGIGPKPHGTTGPAERGSFKLEFFADGIEVPREPVERDGMTITFEDTVISQEVGHIVVETATTDVVRTPPGFKDALVFDPDTLKMFRMKNADPPATVVMDGHVLARNVSRFFFIVPPGYYLISGLTRIGTELRLGLFKVISQFAPVKR